MIEIGGDTLTRMEFRERCQQYPDGLYFFTKAVMMRPKLKAHLHRPFCNFIQLHEWNGGPDKSSRKVAYMPREHFKSTVCSETFPLWLLSCVDPNMTIALISAVDKNPKKWLRKIKETVEHNSIFRWAFPEIRKGPKWDEEEIVITRDRGTGSEVQASVTAYSIRSGLASQHHDYIICDDLVNEQTAGSAIEMARAVELYQSLEEILKGWHDSRGFLVVGTPWGREDVLHEALKEEARGMRYKWGIGALGEFEISDALRANKEMIPNVIIGKPILPTECNEEKLEHIKAQSLDKYHLNYLCKPYDEGRNGFDLSLVGDFAEFPDGRIGCECHPNHYHHLEQGTTLAVSDPAYTKEKTDNNCESSILIANQQPCGCRFLMHDWGSHVQPDGYLMQASLIAQQYKTWLRYWGIEDEALQVALRMWLEDRQKTGVFPLGVRIFGLKARNRQKDARIQKAQPAVNNKFWHKRPNMHRSSHENSLLQQLYQWPYSRKRDRADAFAYFEDAWAEYPPQGLPPKGVDSHLIQVNKRRGDHDIATIMREAAA